MNNSLYNKLRSLTNKVYTNKAMAEYTTMQVGGPADFIVLTNNSDQIIRLINICRDENTSFKLLGGGSNVIISDRGFRGVVIINRAAGWRVLPDAAEEIAGAGSAAARLTSIGDEWYSDAGITETLEKPLRARVRVESGARLMPLTKSLYREGIFGLQWFSGIPATVGGAIYMNMHGGRFFFGDIVESALVFNGQEVRRVNHSYFDFNYDYSILQKTGEFVLEADLQLSRGDIAPAKLAARQWALRKAVQPQKSAGCIFQNLSAEQQAALGLPTPSIGYLIDKVLQLKGVRRGDAIISERHAAFIENLGHARATDVYYLYNLIRNSAREKLNIDLVAEVEFIGSF